MAWLREDTELTSVPSVARRPLASRMHSASSSALAVEYCTASTGA